ncbi:hypothetical protein [Streptomyces sp. NPDC001292]|uniref:hypothetical protein n=1 Tax=Streptomyces sp. NPDC001292 TaxID=3364558 RepID=UPI0036A549F8
MSRAPEIASMPVTSLASAAGREGTLYLVALAYFALGDADRGRANVYDYYRPAGPDGARAAETSGGGDAEVARSADAVL